MNTGRGVNGLLRWPIILGMIVVILIMPATSMWYDSLGVNVTVHMGDPRWEIGSYRGFQKFTYNVCNCSHTACTGLDTLTLSDNAHYLDVKINTTVDWHSPHHCGCNHSITGKVKSIWIGLVLENHGTIPLKLKYVRVTSIGQDTPSSWDMTTYAYGPEKHGIGNKPYWGHLSCFNLPVSGSKPLPYTLPPGYKTVVWINLALNGSGVYVFRFQPVFTAFNQ